MSGGAWKVAYADFVTAMMALFMVLWITAQDDEVVFKTVEYFKDPFGLGFSEGKPGSMSDSGGGASDNFTLTQQQQRKSSLVDLASLSKLASRFYEQLNIDDKNAKTDNKVDVNVTPDGLRVTIYDQSDDPLFKKNTAIFTKWGSFIMQNLAWLMDRNNMSIRIDSHTPSGFEMSDPDYGPWELTVDRSNAARRIIERYSLKPDKISQVSGYADTRPLDGYSRDSEFNQRLEVSFVLD